MPEVKNYPTRIESDEVDLVLALRSGVRYVKSYWTLFLLSVTLGTLGGLAAYHLLPPTYRVTMIADSRMLSSVEVVSIVESWQELIKKKERRALAGRLHVSEAVISQVGKLEADLINQKMVGNNPDDDPFIITANVKDNRVLDDLQAGIIYYLENNKYVKDRVAVKKQNLDSLRRQVNNQIADLNNLKGSLRRLVENGGNGSGAFLTDPASVNEMIVNLYEKRLGIDENLRFIDDIQVIEGFTRFDKPDSPKLSICLVVGFAAGLLVAIGIVAFRGVQSRLA
jgi:LPS O-antigen subunit length determinant protein (WzzB/FepE family)